MKQLIVPFADLPGTDATIETVAAYLAQQEKHLLDIAPWKAYSYKPFVRFSIAYTVDALLLQYEVEEQHIRAAAGAINEAVWKDSCVECFIAFDDMGYYNFEFNCIGTVLGAFGKDRESRHALEPALLQKIESISTIRRCKGQINWRLTAKLPPAVFAFHPAAFSKGSQARANFYKCGDELPQPHFITWNKIEAPQPDFHLPQYFGSLEFE